LWYLRIALAMICCSFNFMDVCDDILYRLRSSVVDEALRQRCYAGPFFCIHNNEIFDEFDEV
jgi:hypothetical protein